MAVVRQKFGRVKEWYEENERRVSSFSLVFGFVFDSLTLQRIDALRENLWVVVNLLVVATCIVLLNRQESDGVDKPGEAKAHFWLFNFLQFGFGALLGTFFIFYFRSATIAAAWPFLFLLLTAMVANEMFQKRYARLTFQISFFYLSLFAFSIFLIPILLNTIGPGVFLLSGAVSLAALAIFIRVLKKFAGEEFMRSKTMLMRSIAGIYIVMNVLYFTNVIPPIPLSLKDAGVYHSISRATDGSYVVAGEEKNIFDYFRTRETFHLVSGQSAYAYSAVFSPAAFRMDIVHEWQYKNETSGEWVTASRIPLSVSGGREQGFRTYSQKGSLTPGLWRVNVATERGQLIGRINFRIVSSSEAPDTQLWVKD